MSTHLSVPLFERMLSVCAGVRQAGCVGLQCFFHV